MQSSFKKKIVTQDFETNRVKLEFKPNSRVNYEKEKKIYDLGNKDFFMELLPYNEDLILTIKMANATLEDLMFWRKAKMIPYGTKGIYKIMCDILDALLFLKEKGISHHK